MNRNNNKFVSGKVGSFHWVSKSTTAITDAPAKRERERNDEKTRIETPTPIPEGFVFEDEGDLIDFQYTHMLQKLHFSEGNIEEYIYNIDDKNPDVIKGKVLIDRPGFSIASESDCRIYEFEYNMRTKEMKKTITTDWDRWWRVGLEGGKKTRRVRDMLPSQHPDGRKEKIGIWCCKCEDLTSWKNFRKSCKECDHQYCMRARGKCGKRGIKKLL